MAGKRKLNLRCTLTGVQTPGVELTKGAFSAISQAAHAARERGERVEPNKDQPPLKIPRRTRESKNAALAAEKAGS